MTVGDACRVLVHGRYTISVEARGRLVWFRLRLGGAVLADDVGRGLSSGDALAALRVELERHGLRLEQFRERR